MLLLDSFLHQKKSKCFKINDDDDGYLGLQAPTLGPLLLQALDGHWAGASVGAHLRRGGVPQPTSQTPASVPEGQLTMGHIL